MSEDDQRAAEEDHQATSSKVASEGDHQKASEKDHQGASSAGKSEEGDQSDQHDPGSKDSSDDEEKDEPFVVYDPPSTFHFIIPNTAATHILVMRPHERGPFAGKHQLPFITPPTDVEDIPAVHSWASQTGDLCSVVLHYLGLHVYVRDLLWRDPNLSSDREENILVADLLESNTIPPKFFWASLEQVGKLAWKIIRSELDIPKLVSETLSASSLSSGTSPQKTGESEKGEPPLPWRRVGWFRGVEQWFMDKIKEKSVRLHQGSRLEQLRNSHHSSLFWCPLETATESDISTLTWYERKSEHYVFLKSSCPGIPEAAITKTVALHLPSFVPKVVATKDDCTFIQLGTGADYYITPEMILRALAEMQHLSLECLESLQADGIPYHGLDWHAKHIESTLQHPVLKSLETEEAYANLVRRIDDLRTLFAELAAYRIPQTLVHGDYSVHNILGDPVERGTLRFVDWATSCIGHPFIDFLRFSVVEDYGSEDENETAKANYLRRWEHFESRENIARAVDLAYPVMLYENLLVLLKMYESAGPLDKEHLLTMLKQRLSDISFCLNSRHRHRYQDMDQSDAVRILIISKDSGRAILARKKNENLSLPFVSLFKLNGKAATNRQLDGHGMRVMIKSQLGIDTRVVRSLWLQPKHETKRKKCALVLETLGVDHQIPVGHQWVDANSVRCFSDGPGREQTVVEAFFEHSSSQHVAPAHMPWRHFGWFVRTSEWADNVLLKHGLKRNGDFYEVKSDIFGTVWKAGVSMAGGKRIRDKYSVTDTVFLKVGLVNPSEGNALSAISTFAEGIVPSVIDIDPNSNAFLTTGLGSADMLNMDWGLLCKGLGQLQIRSIAHNELLVKSGLRRYDCHWVRCNAERLLKDSSELLTKAGGVKVTFTANDIVKCMEELEMFKLPLTLVHGDFHCGNIGRQTETGYGIFDWGSSCIGVPLCDIAVMTKLGDREFCDEEAARQGYLSAWEDKISKTDLDRGIDLSLVYYWVLNVGSLLELMKEIADVDTSCVERLMSDTVQRLNAAIQHARGSEDKNTGKTA